MLTAWKHCTRSSSSEACFVVCCQVGVWFWRYQAYKRRQCITARNGKT